MAKPKLSLSANPTFKCAVGIPVPGAADPVPVEFTFKHRTKSQLKEWRDAMDLENDQITVQNVLEMASGWDLEDPFTEESIATLLEQYPGSGLAIWFRYNQELQDAKLGNLKR